MYVRRSFMNGSLIYNFPTKLGNYRIFAKIKTGKLGNAF